MFFTQADVTEIDLTAGNEVTSFGVVSGSSNIRASIVIRDSMNNFSFSALNELNHSTIFTLNLIDSSTGNMVCIIMNNLATAS